MTIQGVILRYQGGGKRMKKSLGIYIHIPFCIQKCGYCDFCSFPSAVDRYADKYTDELCRRIQRSKGDALDYMVDTVYFGGGTPSLLPIENIQRILSALKSAFDISADAEITLECNPATADAKYFERLRGLGVNRLSIGLQSAIDTELALLGRAHSAEDFVSCFLSARGAGFDNVSADLMYGIPSQTVESFERSIDFLTALAPEHISAYGLSIEEGTRFFREKDKLDLADDDTQAQMYSVCTRRLGEAGYDKYEISNFAKNGRRSRHNLRYWQGLEYLGFGVAAYSYFGSRRYGNSRDITAFIDGKDITAEEEILTPADIREELVMLGLRLTDGIDISEYKERFERDFYEDHPQARDFLKNGFMTERDGRISFTEKGFPVSNTLLAELLCFD